MTDAEFDAAIAALSPWVGRTRIVEDEIGLSSARRIAGMLDMDPASITQGMALPPHWFSMFFPDIAKQSDIGPDGHPHKGVFLPPIPLPRPPLWRRSPSATSSTASCWSSCSRAWR